MELSLIYPCHNYKNKNKRNHIKIYQELVYGRTGFEHIDLTFRLKEAFIRKNWKYFGLLPKTK